MSANQVPDTLPTHPDVLIIGGGSAGVAAAVAAGKSGANVLLVEKNSYGGGKATAAFVGTICGLYFTSENQDPRFVMNGFPKEFAQKLMKLSSSKPEYQKGGLHFLPYERSAFMALCDDYLNKHSKTVIYDSEIIEIKVENNEIISATFSNNNIPITVFPKTVIDTSGEALVSKLSGIAYLKSENYQAAAQVFSISGIAETEAATLNLSIIRTILTGVEQQLLPKEYSRVSVVPGTMKNGSALFKIGIPLTITDDSSCYNEVESFAKKAVDAIFTYLKNNNDFFKDAFISLIAPEAGIRTGPRNLGSYVLSEEDVLACKKFPDAIARGSWPIEFWEPGKNVKLSYFAHDDYYEIPSGAICSPSFKNLFFGGRNISASENAIASARVIGTCLQTGFAAGVFASGYANGISNEQSLKFIQKELFSDEGK